MIQFPKDSAATSDSKYEKHHGEKRVALGDITSKTQNVSKPNEFRLKDAANLPLKTVVSQSAIGESLMKFSNRSYMNRECSDFDAADIDSNKIELVPHLVNEFYDYLHDVERKYKLHPEYLVNCENINEKMRIILVDWMFSVTASFKQSAEVFFLAVQIVDRFLHKSPELRRSKLQLIGMAAMWIASKYEMVYVFSVDDMIKVSNNSYPRENMMQAESAICKTLRWDFTVPHAHTFFCRFARVMNGDRHMITTALYVITRSQQEVSLLRYLPSHIAAAAMYIARMSPPSRSFPWSPNLVKYTGYDECDLRDCCLLMKRLFSSKEPGEVDLNFKKRGLKLENLVYENTLVTL